MTVLVLDRDRRQAERIHELLEEQGHSCLVARDVEEADWLLHVASVEAIAVGIEVPGGDSLDWLEELCLADPRLASGTMVLTPRLLEPGEVGRIQACGAGFLQLPVDVAELEAAFSARLRRRRERRGVSPSAGRRRRAGEAARRDD